MRNGSLNHQFTLAAGPARRSLAGPFALLALTLVTVLSFATPACSAQTQSSAANPPLLDSPQPKAPAHPNPPPNPCQVRRTTLTLAWSSAQSAAQDFPNPTAAAAAAGLGQPLVAATTQAQPPQAPCPNLLPLIDWYARFLDGPQVKPMTPKEKAWLAVRNVADPFNAITILGISAITVGSNAHSPYGPGMPGFGRYVGVSYAQDMTGEFIGTFLIPSIARQDPHYHRMPGATMKRRIAHCIYQVDWTQGDNGRPMVNYADVVGFAIDDEIGNLYVPGQQTRLTASAVRYSTGLATAPIDNFVTEFLPDVARHIHVRVVLIQRIINQVVRTDAAGTP